MAGRGGARPGAGRKLGAIARLDKEARERALSSGLSPLEYMLEVMRDTSEEVGRRLDAAKAAAPYLHAKASVELVEPDPPKRFDIKYHIVDPIPEALRGEKHWPLMPPELHSSAID